MTTVELSSVNHYFRTVEHLPPRMKRRLIAKLEKSLKKRPKKPQKNSPFEFSADFFPDMTADEVIALIKG